MVNKASIGGRPPIPRGLAGRQLGVQSDFADLRVLSAADLPDSTSQSESETISIEPKNRRWIPTSQPSFVLSYLSTFMNALRTWMAEMATIEARSFCFSPP